MKIALINPTPIDHYSPCIRTLSAHLKQHGHEVRLIFLPCDNYNTRFDPGYIKQMKQSLVEDLVECVSDCDLVGVSFLTSMFDVAVQATRAIQKAMPDMPICWGGFHPSTMPQQALEFVDMVCVGEGEMPFLEEDVQITMAVGASDGTQSYQRLVARGRQRRDARGP